MVLTVCLCFCSSAIETTFPLSNIKTKHKFYYYYFFTKFKTIWDTEGGTPPKGEGNIAQGGCLASVYDFLGWKTCFNRSSSPQRERSDIYKTKTTQLGIDAKIKIRKNAFIEAAWRNIIKFCKSNSNLYCHYHFPIQIGIEFTRFRDYFSLSCVCCNTLMRGKWWKEKWKPIRRFECASNITMQLSISSLSIMQIEKQLKWFAR